VDDPAGGPRVTVALATRNRGASVLRTLASVLGNGLPATDVVVVDQSDDEATAFAKEVAGNGSRRIQYLELIECGPYNDAVHATWGYAVGAKYGQEHVAPTGRVIRLVKYHPDNRKRIQQGLPPMRNIELGDPSWPKQDPPREAFWQWDEAKQAFEYLWLPKLDYDALWNELRIAVDPEPWEGAVEEEVLRSKIFPPPVITNLGLANVPTGMTWGCPGLPLMES